jgi:hypothetical protein
VLQVACLGLWAYGLHLLGSPSNGSATRPAVGIALLVAGTLVGALIFRFPIGWTLTYKGHQLRFHNHPIRGERLYIDGVLADRGRLALNVTTRGTIQSGAGAGERITAHSRAGLTSFSCLMIAESFVTGGP